jgi:hypothetical protein
MSRGAISAGVKPSGTQHRYCLLNVYICPWHNFVSSCMCDFVQGMLINQSILPCVMVVELWSAEGGNSDYNGLFGYR